MNRFVQIILKKMYRTHYCYGDKTRLHVGNNVSLMNTLFNLSSGRVFIADNTIFGHNCMVITGTHRFYKGVRLSLSGKKRKIFNKDKIGVIRMNSISINELSELTQYSKKYLKELIKNNSLPVNGTAVNPLFYKEEIIEWMNSKEAPITGRDIVIGSGCFIGSGAIINGGVTIGDNTIVGSGSVVTKDQPSGTIIGGVPATIIKKM